MELRTKLTLVATALLVVAGSASAKASTDDVQSIISSHKKIQKLGFQRAFAESAWPDEHQISLERAQFAMMVGESSNITGQDNDLPWDECNFNPLAPGCGQFPNVSPTGVGSQLKDDAVQILTTEVLYQTLSYYKVKNAFGKVKNKNNTTSWVFKVIDPVDGEAFQDLDTDSVVYAVKQFRKYVIGLLCNQPTPSRILGMMNAYDVGTRFRWDMAWALLGNDLPDAPNKFMTFGTKWRKFSAAIDGIQNNSIVRIKNANGNGGFEPLSVAPETPAPGGSTISKVGFIAKEVIGVIRLVGDIVAAVLDLVCVSDLSVSQKAELEKQTVLTKLLAVKKQAYDRYGPLRPALDEIGKRATEASGKLVTVLP